MKELHEMLLQSIETRDNDMGVRFVVGLVSSAFAEQNGAPEMSLEAKKMRADFFVPFLQVREKGEMFAPEHEANIDWPAFENFAVPALLCAQKEGLLKGNFDDHVSSLKDFFLHEKEEVASEDIEKYLSILKDDKRMAEQLAKRIMSQKKPLTGHKDMIHEDYASLLFSLLVFFNSFATSNEKKGYEFFLNLPLEELTLGITDNDIREYLNGDHTKISEEKLAKVLDITEKAGYLFPGRCVFVKLCLLQQNATHEQIERVWQDF